MELITGITITVKSPKNRSLVLIYIRLLNVFFIRSFQPLQKTEISNEDTTRRFNFDLSIFQNVVCLSQTGIEISRHVYGRVYEHG